MVFQKIPARIRWAVDVLDVQPDDQVLEIGCGPGAAAGLIASRLEKGRLLAIDRSESGVDRTKRRNAALVESGRLVVRHIDLATLRVPVKRLDKVFAFNVNLFWVRECHNEVALLHERLNPGGAVHLFYDASRRDQVPMIVEKASAALAQGDFRVSVVRANARLWSGSSVVGERPLVAGSGATRRCSGVSGDIGEAEGPCTQRGSGPTTARISGCENSSAASLDVVDCDRLDPGQHLVDARAARRRPARPCRSATSASRSPRARAPARRAACPCRAQLLGGMPSAATLRSSSRTTASTSSNFAGRHPTDDAHYAGVGVVAGEREHGVGQAAVLADLLEQPRGGAAAERGVEYAEGEAPRRRLRIRPVDAEDQVDLLERPAGRDAPGDHPRAWSATAGRGR